MKAETPEAKLKRLYELRECVLAKNPHLTREQREGYELSYQVLRGMIDELERVLTAKAVCLIAEASR